jgi:hypothetical protein
MLKDKKQFDAEKLVDEVLSTEPCFILSDSFADIVAEKVSRKFAWEQYLKEFFVYLGVIVGICIGIAAISIFWFGNDWKYWIEYVVSNSGLVAGTGIITTFILFADRGLLRYFMFKSEMETI